MFVNVSRKELQLIIRALTMACDEAHTMIATCPDVVTYADKINQYRAEIVNIRSLQERLRKCR